MRSFKKSRICFKLPYFADILVARCLSENKFLQGEFIIENNAEKTVWWTEKSRQCKSLAKKLPWKTGVPEKFELLSSARLAERLPFITDPKNAIHDRVIIKTADEHSFITIIRHHFLVQKGKIEYILPGSKCPDFLIRIEKPSLFCLTRLASDLNFIIYNQVTNGSGAYVDGLYIKQGFSLKPFIFIGQIRFLKGIFLIHDQLSTDNYQINWLTTDHLIRIEGEAPCHEPVPMDIDITVTPTLKDDDAWPDPVLWEADAQKLMEIIKTIPYESLTGYSAWFTDSGRVYILAAKGVLHTRFHTILCDAFNAFVRYENRIFIIRGKTLMPRLPEDMILQAYDTAPDNYLCFQTNSEDNVRVIRFPEKRLKKLKYFVEYQAERAVQSIDNFESQWQFDFADLKKKP